MVRRGRWCTGLVPKLRRARRLSHGIPRISERYSTLRTLGRMWSTTRHDLPCLSRRRHLVQSCLGSIADERRRVAFRVRVACFQGG